MPLTADTDEPTPGLLSVQFPDYARFGCTEPRP